MIAILAVGLVLLVTLPFWLLGLALRVLRLRRGRRP